ncbi:inosine/uridine-preferring nucleoside hydrolase [Bimuria novae-zelandiae CBS 107.79]|uniref:Inosine/uridine-preferring nucleoside hydrolase n=1 Tax=Bimuria novae-zelandiae CBS 107.79 TaxID=1447943 RepID=A0A6A5UK72_9PLEO|nr:inosine/uridine-preferring nucleoside hydrolase [Bimuria novae-zelandiae CBS 107.79]
MRLQSTASLLALMNHTALAPRKNLIIDTDLHSDVDDASALMLGATLPNLNLLGVNVNHPSEYSALAASAILAHYGHADTPISIPRPMNSVTFFDKKNYKVGEYTSKVAYHWSGGTLPWGKAEDAWDPVFLYRKLLSEAGDGSVTIASIGFLDNISALLDSQPDKYSPMNGRALVRAKVHELAVMGGTYPTGRSWNFYGSNPSRAAHVINTWEGKITFVGNDVGKHVLVGAPLMASTFEDDPIRQSYVWYGFGKPLPSWDPLTILYVANGLGEIFEIANDKGFNRILEDGTNEWVDDGVRRGQRYLKLRAGSEVAAAELDRLFLVAAERFSKYAKTWGEGKGEL